MLSCIAYRFAFAFSDSALFLLSGFSRSHHIEDLNHKPIKKANEIIELKPKMLSLSRASIKLARSVTILPAILIPHDLEILCHSVCNSAITRDTIADKRYYNVSPDSARANWMISKLSREGKIREAGELFNELSDRDVVLWTTMINGYVKCGLIEEARKLFDRVDAKKNVVTWTGMISGYWRLRRIREAEILFDEMPVKNVVSWNTMIYGYAENGKLGKALKLFEKMPEKNVVTWNTIITALSQHGRIEEAKGLFDTMPKRDVISWTAMVGGLAKNGRVDEAKEIFDRMPEKNVVSWNSMITGYTQNKRVNEALELFERMPERDLPSWNTMITGLIQNGEFNKAWKLFDEMPQKNVISWTTMITGYVQYGLSEEALKMFSRMLEDGEVKSNQGTFVSVLSACSDLAGLGEGQQIHQIITKSVYQNNEFVVSALINMYSKCGELGTARKMFDDGLISQRDLISWNGMIASYAHHGHGMEAIGLFNKMKELGFKPDDVTYVGLLAACSHSGLVEEGMNYFDELVKDKSIQVREDHYACLVDLCGRAGRLKEAFKFIERLGVKPSAAVWGALLAGCNVHRDVDIGKVAAKELLKVEPDNPGTYMLLANIYASTGKWKEAANLRMKMKDKGFKKQPGCSWIEVGNQVRVFVAGDKSQSRSGLIYHVLHDLHTKMKKIKRVSDGDDMIFFT